MAWVIRGPLSWELLPAVEVGALRNTFGELAPRDRWYFTRRRDAIRWAKARGFRVYT